MDIILYGSPSTAATIAHWLLIELDWSIAWSFLISGGVSTSPRNTCV